MGWPLTGMNPNPAMRQPFWKRFAGRVFDAGWVLSYAVFPSSYRFYRACKVSGNRLFRQHEAVSPPLDWDHIRVVFDGFRHSGNTFLTDNLRPEWRPRAASIVHRNWVLDGAVQRGIPAFLLIRDPLEVAWSRRYRVAGGEAATYGVASSVSATLLCWYLYYGSAWKLRKHLIVLPFPMLAQDYPALRERVEGQIGPAMAPSPSFAMQNRFEGPRSQEELSPLANWLLRRCQRRFERFMKLAEATGVPKAYCRRA